MAAGNPIQALLGMLGGGAQGSPQGGAPPQADPSQALGQQVSQQLSDLNGADPMQVMNQLKQWKGGVAGLIPHLAFRVPKAAPHLAKAMSGLEKAIEAMSEAAVTAQTVGMNPPLGMSAASPNVGNGGGGF